MLNRKLPLVAALTLTAPLLALGTQERQLKDSDLKKFATKLADYIEAKQRNKDLVETEEELNEELAKLQKKLKGTDPLACSLDIGRAIWLSHKYDKARTKKGKVSDEDFESSFIGEDGLVYSVWAPKGYDPKNTSYPLIITIPDDDPDMSPSEHIMQNWTNQDIRDNAILVAPTMPEDVSMWGTAGEAGNPGGVAYALTTLKAITKRYAVDPDRIYLSGRGAGVGAALTIASYFPDRFAGVIGRSGDASEVQHLNMRNLPTYFAAPGGNATAYQEKVKEAGYDNCTIEMEGKEVDIWNWIQEHPRAANPDQVTLVPGQPFPVRAYWLAVRPSAETSARLDATIERESNTIRIDAQGLTDVRLFLNDTLVDLDQPVKFVCNGVETVETIPRSLKLALKFVFDAQSDSGRVFVAGHSLSIPERAKAE